MKDFDLFACGHWDRRSRQSIPLFKKEPLSGPTGAHLKVFALAMLPNAHATDCGGCPSRQINYRGGNETLQELSKITRTALEKTK